VKRIFIPTVNGSDWQRLLAQPKLQWKKGASAMTAAAAWEDAGDGLPKEIATTLQSSNERALQDLRLLAAFLEWEVSLEGGETASHTDVLALARSNLGLCVIAVEAKVNESFGSLLRQKRFKASVGQLRRLEYLQSVLDTPHFDDLIRYQLIHRTASALLTAREFQAQAAVMLVYCFGDKTNLKSDFDAFCNALSAQSLSAGVCVAPRFSAPRLYMAWCDGNRKYLDVELPSLKEDYWQRATQL
jgi:hypothetical protein